MNHCQKTPITNREIEVLKLIAEQHTTKEISHKLYISPETVITHRKNLRRKLEVKNVAGLIYKSFMLQLLPVFSIIILFGISQHSIAQTIGMELTAGENISENGDSGAIMIDVGDPEQKLAIDDYGMQTYFADAASGILYLQPYGGCVAMPLYGLTYASRMITDTVYYPSPTVGQYEVQTHASGEIAYGTVWGGSGNRISGSENWMSTYNEALQRYEIQIDDEDYHYRQYPTQITMAGGSPKIGVTSSVDGTMLVKIYDLLGELTTNDFSFVVYKYEKVNELEDCYAERPPEILVSPKSPVKSPSQVTTKK